MTPGAPGALAAPGPLGYAGLAFCGAGWGLTTPMIKIATGAGHGALTIALWHTLLTVIALGLWLGFRGGFRSLPLDGAALRL